uniref:Uncharacterized protein n=1 Tax=Escherichia coli TaxID=562 RepID=A0A6G9I2P2_ECOLX|nr:hypothetical protein [Escherichia coli]
MDLYKANFKRVLSDFSVLEKILESAKPQILASIVLIMK